MKERKSDRFIMQDHYNRMELEDAKFILDHAEKQLKDTLDTNTLIIGRLTTLVTITTALLIGLMGYAVTRVDTHSPKDCLFITAVSGIFYLYIPATLIVVNFMSKKYALPGSEPKDFFVDQTFADQNKPYLKAIYCNEVIEYQKRIKYNKKKNNRRWNLFNIALILILLSPLALYLIYTLVTPLS